MKVFPCTTIPTPVPEQPRKYSEDFEEGIYINSNKDVYLIITNPPKSTVRAVLCYMPTPQKLELAAAILTSNYWTRTNSKLCMEIK